MGQWLSNRTESRAPLHPLHPIPMHVDGGGAQTSSYIALPRTPDVEAQERTAFDTAKSINLFRTFSEIHPDTWKGLSTPITAVLLGMNMLVCRVGLSVVSKMAFVTREEPNMLF